MALKVIVEIEIGNDAVQTGFDVAELLQQAADRVEERIGGDTIEEDGYYARSFGNLKDSNGNTVGLWKVQAE